MKCVTKSDAVIQTKEYLYIQMPQADNAEAQQMV